MYDTASLTQQPPYAMIADVVNDVERVQGHSTPRLQRRGWLLRRAFVPVLAVITVCSVTVIPAARPAVADPLSDAKAKAAQLEQQIQTTQHEISAQGQRYDEAQIQITAATQAIAQTQAKIVQDRILVAKDKKTLSEAALNAYVHDGTAAVENPLFAGAGSKVAAENEYTQIAEGNVNKAIDELHTAGSKLAAQQSALRVQDEQAVNAAAAARTATQQADLAQNQENAALAQAKGQVATLIAQQQAAQAAAAQAAAEAKLAAAQQAAAAAQKAAAAAHQGPSTGSSPLTGSATPAYIPPPPPAPGGAGATAVAAAESFLGVPYVWGGATPSGLDCSGLTMLAWAAAGVSLPHYSGAQMAVSTPVPLSDLQPGDLLFYGPGGGEHEAMYIGGGSMIESPHTGLAVRITGLRLGDGFVGAGRPLGG